MGGENSAFKALVPGAGHRLHARRLSDYAPTTDSEEEINVHDESDLEDRPERSRSTSPVVVDDDPRGTEHQLPTCQPLQLTMHDRD
ncbi:unnamed protein product [Acanthoscelides obtectus]|uniref:Uncharacterized protein n=1 Tax=Acanthoscelides obtectus TaxID=200917 RepID=A0A9P0KX98_ACAOB|nr:unnamed protein product [Acanthoscelides obtectus]CAK1665973.1 hypothetical protein AOBTE_LOCUS25082 [Acanthoscelides obtectus]